MTILLPHPESVVYNCILVVSDGSPSAMLDVSITETLNGLTQITNYWCSSYQPPADDTCITVVAWYYRSAAAVLSSRTSSVATATGPDISITECFRKNSYPIGPSFLLAEKESIYGITVYHCIVSVSYTHLTLPTNREV